MAAKKQTMCFRIRPKYAEKLDELAENKDVTRSDLIRQIVENFIEMHS